MKTKKSAVFAGVLAFIFGLALIGCDNNGSAGKPPNANADYGIDLGETSTYTFPAAIAGYGAQTPKSVTITNTGKQPTGDLVAALSVANGEAFVLSPSMIGAIAAGSTAAFTVVPKTGLAVGTYTATVTVSGGTVIAKSFTVSFTVGDSSSSPSTVFTSVVAALAYLNAHSDGNTADKSVPLKMNVNLSSATDNWDALVGGLSAAGKYAALDLSLCSMNGTEFDLYHDTNPDPTDGRKYIVSLVLPDSAASVVNSGSYIIPSYEPPTIVYPGSGPGSAPSVANSGGYMPYYNEIPIIVNSDYSSLKTVSGANVETIGSYAFTYCTALTTASFPKVTSIGGGDTHGNRGAFEGCTSLTTASFPKATSIGHGAFSGCTSLTTASFPEVTSIGGAAFLECTALTSVSFPKAISIGNYTFESCTSLIEISFPKVTDISYDAFWKCTSLTTVYLPEVTTIKYGAFLECTSLTTVSIPKATTIENGVFSGCSALTTLAFPEATSVSIGIFGSYGSCTALTEVSAPKATSVSFSGCTSMTEVSFPKATDVSFSGCTSLTTVSAPKATSVSFSGCTSLTTVSFPEVTSVGGYAFSGCTSLTTVSFPEATDILGYAFDGCTALTTVSFPKVTSIWYGIFQNSGTTPLTITMGAAAPTVGGGTFNGVTATKNVTVKVPNGATGSYNATWQTAFKGGNSYINLVIEYY